jgi:hypothetical protein
MHVLFIYPDLSSTITGYTGTPSYGVVSLVAALRAQGHECGLLGGCTLAVLRAKGRSA